MSKEKGLVIGQDLIDSLHIDMLAHVVSQFVVLLFLEGLIVEGCICQAQFLGEGLQEEVHEGGIVEDAVNVSAHTFVVDDVAVLATIGKMQQGRGQSGAEGLCLPHVDLIASHIIGIGQTRTNSDFFLGRKRERGLASDFLATHRGGDG